MGPNQAEPAPAVTGLVLAGGRSTRFGTEAENKAVAKLASRTLLGRVVDAVTAATDRSPVVAVRTASQREDYARVVGDRDVIFTSDASAFDGPLAGVYGGIEAVDTPWLFLCGCDMPLLSPDAIMWLVDRLATHQEADDTTADALAVRHPDGRVDPLHALYRTPKVDYLRGEIVPTDGPRAVLESLPTVRTVSVDAAPPGVPLERSIININTRDDLKHVVSRVQTEQ